MIKVVLDSCSLINMINGDILLNVLSMREYQFYVGDLVIEECFELEEQKVIIQLYINSGLLTILSDCISLTEFMIIKDKYGLGDGESESIAIAAKLSYAIATDDKKARASSVAELSKESLCGTIFFIRELVRATVLECVEGLAVLQLIRSKGGFIPNVNRSYICK